MAMVHKGTTVDSPGGIPGCPASHPSGAEGSIAPLLWPRDQLRYLSDRIVFCTVQPGLNAATAACFRMVTLRECIHEANTAQRLAWHTGQHFCGGLCEWTAYHAVKFYRPVTSLLPAMHRAIRCSLSRCGRSEWRIQNIGRTGKSESYLGSD